MRLQWRRVAFAFSVVAALLYVLVRQMTTGPANVLLIVVDTLRADRVGVNGNPQGLTPFLDALAGRGTAFVNAYAPSSWTCPSVASLFTSRYPSQHRATTFEAILGSDEVTLAELLSERGYGSGGFSANIRVTNTNGYAQGFGFWQIYLGAPSMNGKARGEVLREASLKWLRTTLAQAPRRPVLLYLQYMEPHAPYDPPEPYRSRFAHVAAGVDLAAANKALLRMAAVGLRGLSATEIAGLTTLYDGEVAAVDEELRLLFAQLEQLGFLRNAFVVITADHGEEFAEHDELLHGATLYQPAIRIPLIVVGPGVDRGRIVAENVSLIDIAPTLLDLLDLPADNHFEGRSLAPLIRAPTAHGWWQRWLGTSAAQPDPTVETSGEIISELEPLGRRIEVRVHQRTLVRDRHKIVVPLSGAAQTYDLAADPQERSPVDLSEVPDAAGTALLRDLDEKRATLQAKAATTTHEHALDDATKEKLRALGYHP